MKESERRLLIIFLTLVVLLGGVVGIHQMRAWQHRLERREREAQLAQMEATALLAGAPAWKARGAWLKQTLPVAGSELEANRGLLDTLSSTADAAGLKITNTQIETVEQNEYYRQFGITLGVKGQLPALMRWIHERLDPASFYVVPSLRITPDKDDPALVSAQVRFLRWFSTDYPVASGPSSYEPPLSPTE